MIETPQQYVQRITAYVVGQEPLVVQAATAQILEQLIAQVPTSRLRTRPAPDRWSASEIVTHLADAEIVTGFRLRLILGSPGTNITSYDQNAWVTSGHYDMREASRSVQQFRALREANLTLLDTLTPDQWKHYGMHSERGRETIEQIVLLTAGHDINHVKQIERIARSR